MKTDDLAGDYQLIKLSEIRPNEWNPNEMDTKTFNRLAREIQESGFLEPIQVIPADEDEAGSKYVILGGQHRFEAVTSLGWEMIPAIIMTDEQWQDVDQQKLETVRLNALRGDLNKAKFLELAADLASRHGIEDLQDKMAFADDDKYQELTKDMLDRVNGSNLPDVIKKEFKEKVKSKRHTMQGLSKILNGLFQKYGSTLDQNYMFFEYGGRKHVKIRTDAFLWKKINSLLASVSSHGVDANEVFKDMIRRYDESRIQNMPKIVKTAESEES